MPAKKTAKKTAAKTLKKKAPAAGTAKTSRKAAAPARKKTATTAKAKAKPAAQRAKSAPSAKARSAKKPGKVAAKQSGAKPRSAKPKSASAKPTTSKAAKTKPASEKAAQPKPVKTKPVKLTGFFKKQRQRLLDLKDSLLDAMNGVARDTLRSRAEGSEAKAFGMHQADAGSDAYDRDFALSLLSQEQDSLYEIDEALKRLETGEYGVCEMSGKEIPHARLEALPFTRYTVECQAEIEKNNRFRARQPVTSLFGLSDDDSDDEDSSDGKD